MESAVVDSGIQAVGKLQWGAHFCQFYKSQHDLADILIPYFLAAINGNEQCIWVTSKPFQVDDVRALFGAVVPDISAIERSGQLQIIDYQDWYLKTGSLTMDGLFQMWTERQELALRRGYAGLRVTGNTSWLDHRTWKSFIQYEAKASGAFEGLRILGLCTYSLDRCGAHRVVDVVQAHQFALIRRLETWELIESSPLKIAKQELRRLNEDLEARVRQRTAELEAALRVREDFISVASHELKTPLAALKLYVEGLLRAGNKGTSSSGQLVERLAKVKAECGRLERLVNYLLDFSCAMSGGLSLSHEEVDLSELARMTAERFAQSSQEAGCTLSLRAEAPVIGMWDRLRVEQVLVNILSNAIKYAPGALIEVTVTEQDGQAVFSVRDQGPGIAPVDQGRIFERFVQLSPTEQHRGGLGVGLWIVRKIVDAYHGTVDLTSAPGEGSTFTVTLPRVLSESS